MAISSGEVFAKPVTSLSLALDWFGLPVNATGFQGWYAGYVIDANGIYKPPGTIFVNTSFLATLSIANPGWWTLATPDAQRNLFATLPPPTQPLTAPPIYPPAADAPLADSVVFAGTIASNTPKGAWDPATSAVQLTLAAPAYAFGNTIFAANVMAASVQLTAAASACAQQCGALDDGGLAALIEPLIAANADAEADQLAETVGNAAILAMANLDGATLQAIDAAIATADADAATRTAWRDDLVTALDAATATGLRSLLSFLRPDVPDALQVHDNLQGWLATWRVTCADALANPLANAAVSRATALMTAGSAIIAAAKASGDQPAAIARPVNAARLAEIRAQLMATIGDTKSGAQNCVQDCLSQNPVALPNQPWLPQTSALSISYAAATALPLPKGAPSIAAATFCHLGPFDSVSAVPWLPGGDVPLLPPVLAKGSLAIGLTGALPDRLTLFFQLAPPAAGWSNDTPAIAWTIATCAGCVPVTPLRDTTNNLRNTGIITLPLPTVPLASPLLLRASVDSDTMAFPDLVALVSNAATATWIPSGGAAQLGQPKPAGTVKKTIVPLPVLGSVDQPMPSEGGMPALADAAFKLWLAERLRHKDRGIEAWDYARIVLAAWPSLWQVAIVPASDDNNSPAPGQVWVIPVPGPTAPAVADPTIPSSSSAVLQDVADLLQARISPFVQLIVTNPPYVRVTVHAQICFSDSDSADACRARLNEDLIAWLSPWPDPALQPRPRDYYTRREVAHFIRHRPYVAWIKQLRLVIDDDDCRGSWRYLTSATQHVIHAVACPAAPAVRPARLSLVPPRPSPSGGPA